MAKTSAGLIMYRIKNSEPEVFLVHPGGPFYTNKNDGAWSIPKGESENGETGEAMLGVAKREFEEETGFAHSGPYEYVGKVVRERDKKTVEAWAFKGDCDPAELKSNTIFVEWPPRSGKKIKVPEIDRGDFFTIARAKEKISPYMLPLIEQFEKLVQSKL